MKLRGFTLLEVLIAIALLVALLGTMFGFLFDMLDSRRHAKEHGGRQMAAGTLIDRLEADLIHSIVGDGGVGAGVRGDEAHLRILTRSVHASAAESNVEDAEILGDLQRGEYRFLPAGQRVEARRTPVTNTELPEQAFLPLHDARAPISLVRFRYYDGAEWRSSFDSLEEDGLPVAVEVAIWFRSSPTETDLEVIQAVSQPDAHESGVAGLSKDGAANMEFGGHASARNINRNDGDGPPPDRVRVILIPDSAGDQDAGGAP